MATNIPYTPRAFTQKQFRTLLSLADTYIPSLTQEEIDQLFRDQVSNLIVSPRKEKIERWLRQSATECKDFVETLDYLFYARIPKEAKNRVAMVLDLLGGGIATFLLTLPYFSFTQFSSLSQSHRIKILKSWSQSYLPSLRQLHRQLQLLFANILLKRDEILSSAIEYPRPIPGIHRRESADSPGETTKVPGNDRANPFTFLDLSNIPKPFLSPSAFAKETSGTSHNEITTLYFDLIIVGTGAGGSVACSTISRALLPKYEGYRILIIDKGTYYNPATDFPMDEFNLGEKMCDNGGNFYTVDGAGIMMGASTWGGGPVINWGISFDLEDHVKRDWLGKYGLEVFAPIGKTDQVAGLSEWDSCIQRVRSRMGVSLLSSEHHSMATRLIEEGAKKAGYNPVPVSLNNGGKPDEHKDCGYCTLGCTRGIKQSGAVSWLVDAAEAGATMLKEFDVEKVLFEGEEQDMPMTDGNPLVVKGIEGRIVNSSGNGTLFRILASRVILSAGAIRTPCIMKNSGLDSSNIGENLKLHPGFQTIGFVDSPINPWDNGPPVTLYVPDLTSIDNTGFGPKIMKMDHHPAIALTLIPWNDPAEYKLNLCRYKQAICLLAIVRDRDSYGSVTPTTKSNSGNLMCPKIEYTFGKFDKNSAKEGILATIKILVNAGCSEVFPCIESLPRHLLSYKKGGNVPLEKYLQDLERYLPAASYGSAHLMGTARLGNSKRNSVVDAKTGKVWDVAGLHVADGSLFPEPSGVNPMLTIMGLSEWVARKVVKEVESELGVFH